MPFVTAYVGFLQHRRSNYPSATIVCLIQQSGSDVNINQAITTFKTGGGDNVESFDINVSAAAAAAATAIRTWPRIRRWGTSSRRS